MGKIILAVFFIIDMYYLGGFMTSAGINVADYQHNHSPDAIINLIYNVGMSAVTAMIGIIILILQLISAVNTQCEQKNTQGPLGVTLDPS